MIKKVFKGIGILLLAIIILITVLAGYFYFSQTGKINAAMEKAGPPVNTLTIDGKTFRDLNKNAELDPYEDHRLSVNERVEDLLAQMTVEEKAGLMFHSPAAVGSDGDFAGVFNIMNFLPLEEALLDKQMNFFNLFAVPEAALLAEWQNKVQELAERTRLGIPVTISSDPRHTTMKLATVGFNIEGFSKWTEPIGLAAIGDSAFVHKFGEIAAQEYRAVGIHTALHPMPDLATDPRWARISGTFGEDADLSAKLTAAYVHGFQGDSLTSSSVSTMTKHFPGGGPQEDGWDAHFRFGKDQVYPGNNFDYHLIPFEAAIEVGTSQIMPYYGVPVGQTSEEVGFAFNKEIITDLLQDSLRYEGIVCTDWGLINTTTILGYPIENIIPFAGTKNYGVEDLAPVLRVKKALDAGVDQFGGESTPELVVQLVKEGSIPESRLDLSVRKLLALKFRLGLFDDPYVDVEMVNERTGTDEAMQMGYESQLRSQVLLTNNKVNGQSILPLQQGTKIYIENLDSEVASEYGQVVETVEEADVAILNLEAPKDPDIGSFAGMSLFPMGRLYYTDEELAPVMEIIHQKPTVITTYLSRPAVIPELADSASAILANFGSSNEAIFDLLFGEFNPTGKLPFEMPSSWEAVLNQKEDVPFDSEDPLFPFGYGLSYK
ncbi:MAG: glycoside hydrolase family 3 N-terminal domain-containing protein [Balneolaceae bacterium]|nr:glycoside hydrolase family 3 N-terminal domain-containing protein [Balneolaceae bacterium]